MNDKINSLEMLRFYCPLGIDISGMHVETEKRPQLGDVFRIPRGHQKLFEFGAYVVSDNHQLKEFWIREVQRRNYQGNRGLKI